MCSSDLVKPADVFNAASGFVTALEQVFGKGSKLIINDKEFTLGSVDIKELAKTLLGDLTPAEFLEEGASITAGYAASVEYKNTAISLSGTLEFTAVGTENSLLNALQVKIDALNAEGVFVTLDGQNISVKFEDDVKPADVFNAEIGRAHV